MQITITIDEASGRITVEADGQEPYECSSSEECLEYLAALMGGGEEAEGEPEMPSGDMAEMWNEEAAKRPTNPNMMR